MTTNNNPLEAAHARYTNADLMQAWLDAPETLRGRLDRAYRCLHTARDPQGKFGLDTVPAAVIETIEARVAELQEAVRPLQAALVTYRLQGLSWDEAWSFAAGDLGDLQGFGPGDAYVLGFTLGRDEASRIPGAAAVAVGCFAHGLHRWEVR